MQHLIGILLVVLPAADEPIQRTSQDCQKVIETNKKYLEKMFDPEYWKKIQVKDKTLDIEKKFTELDKVEQRTFVLIFSQQLLERLQNLQKSWDNDVYPDIPKKEMECYRQELLSFRKKFTKAYTEHVENMLIELKDEITEPEKRILIRKAQKIQELLPKE